MKYVVLLFIALTATCGNAEALVVGTEKGYVVKYNAIEINYKGKKIAVPIFEGQKGVLTEQMIQNGLPGIKVTNGMTIIENMVIPIGSRKTKDVFISLLQFYEKSLLKNNDIETPSVVGFEGNSPAIIWYDFKIEGVPCSMMLVVDITEYKGYWNTSLYKEKSDEIAVSIFIGQGSSFADEPKDWINYYRQ